MNGYLQCGLAMVPLAFVAVTVWQRRAMQRAAQEQQKHQEAWSRNRQRAPIVKVGKIEDGVMVGWAFYVRRGYHTILQTCPVTGQTIVWGYSPQELHEIASRPAEFAQPELEWFQPEQE